ncbi:hypothetical protein Dip518_000338 [Parelusimicrobium proximum]|uniref:hypothetical protein n=1 Tax=Parelusimicrobium proximum TaxID=3228953 RepID=UPI003D1634F1
MKKIVLLLPLLFLGCTTLALNPQSGSDWIQIGPLFDASKDDVTVFVSKDEITRPYGYVGVQTIKNLKPQRDMMQSALALIKKSAKKHGGDAVIVGQYFDEDGGTGLITMSGHVIKYVDNLTDKDKLALEEYKVLGAVTK